MNVCLAVWFYIIQQDFFFRLTCCFVLQRKEHFVEVEKHVGIKLMHKRVLCDIDEETEKNTCRLKGRRLDVDGQGKVVLYNSFAQQDVNDIVSQYRSPSIVSQSI